MAFPISGEARTSSMSICWRAAKRMREISPPISLVPWPKLRLADRSKRQVHGQSFKVMVADAKGAQMRNRIENIIPARAGLAMALQDVAHLRRMVETAGVLRMSAVDNEGERLDW